MLSVQTLPRRVQGALSAGRQGKVHRPLRHVVVATWQRPQPDKDADFIKPSYVPNPSAVPMYEPPSEQPFFTPSVPEFQPAEIPETQKELPSGPKMPERRPDPIPAGNPKEKPPAGDPDKREAPPPKEREEQPATKP